MKNKEITISVRKKEYEQISQRAKESDLSVEEYVLKAALADNGITVEQKKEVYKNLCLIKDYTLFNSDFKKIPKACDAIWLMLK